MLSNLTVGNEDVVGTALEFAEARVDRDLAGYRAAADRWQVDADTLSDQLRSGNPALKAAALEANPREMLAGLRALNDAIDDFFTGSPPQLVNEATGTWAVGVR